MMKNGSAAAFGAALVLAASTVSGAAVHRVPLDYGSINAALGAAAGGDTVKVSAGTYFESVALVDGVELRGGYDGTYADPADPSANVTRIHGSDVSPAVTATGVGSATIVDGFTLTGGGGSPGAGVVVSGGAPVFRHNVISGNRRAGVAGGVYIAGGSTALFESNTVRDNSSQGSGGGFHVEHSSPTLTGNVIEANVAPNAGGGIYAFFSPIVCTGNTFRNNLAGNGGGGAIRVQYTVSGTQVVNCTFDACVSAFGGGVFVKDASSVTLTGCDFVDCRADWSGASSDTTTHHGGGIAVGPFCTATATDCTFLRCQAVGSIARGGAAYVRQGTLSIVGTGDPTVSNPNSFIVDCTSDYRGGGVWAENCTSGTFAGIAFDNCSAPGLGGGMYVSECALDIDQNLFTSCSADDGGAILLTSAQSNPPVSRIRNNTIFGCSASSSTKGGGIGHYGGANKRVALIAGTIISNTLTGACITCGSLTGTGTGAKPGINCTTVYQDPTNAAAALVNVACTSAFGSDATNRTGDPLFCGSGDYRLQSCSPEVGAVCGLALPSLPNRGAAPLTCACQLVSALEHSSWGQIKARYR